jgi:rod shape determining protein RodA
MAHSDFVRHSVDAGLRSAAAPRAPLLRFDPVLALLLLALVGLGLTVLYSAVDRDMDRVAAQGARLGLGAVVMLAAAQFPPRFYERWAPVLYGVGVLALVLVLVVGESSKGATRWLDFPGLPRFQPSEIMKLALPLMVAGVLARRPALRLPDLLVSGILIAVPMLLILLQPDLGTSLLIAASGFWALLLAGLSWSFLLAAGAAAAAAAPLLYHYVLRDYQKERVLTLFDPERDPLGAGWNTIQAKTAIGSGGVTGKGLFEGTQSHLDFLPERHTDFIIAVLAEELGLIGVLALLGLYLLIVARGLAIAIHAGDPFGRLLAGSLTLTFFVYVFVNAAMVSGLLPIVGVPLPLVSYGGTSAVTLLAGFGLLMSVHAHRRRP